VGSRRVGFFRWTRWSLFVLAVSTGVALLLTVWVSYRSMNRASGSVVLSTGQSMAQAIGRRVRFRVDLPTKEELDGILDEHKASGLRYVAVHAPLLLQQVSAGSPLGNGDLPQTPPRGQRHRLIPLDGRIRMVWYPHRPPPHRLLPRHFREQLKREAEANGVRGPGPFAPEPGRLGRFRRILVLEFEPLAQQQIQAEATRTLIVGCVATGALLLLASLFWLLLRRQEREEARLERDRRLASLGEMSAVLAHEIRNPLASLKGHAQLLVELLPAESKERQKAERVVKEAERLDGISGDLLDFIREGPLNLRPITPEVLLTSVADTLDPARIRIDATNAPRSWSLDERRIRQVLTNVLSNALEASPPPREVDARITCENDMLWFTIRDYGPGIDPEQLQRIFDPFFTTKVRGTGLGLAVAHRLVSLHNGKLEGANHPDGGAEFAIGLPRTKESAHHGQDPRGR
jgi:two-component system sensor histidine kinase HydH